MQSKALPPTSRTDTRLRLLAGTQRAASVIAKHKTAAEERAAQALCTDRAVAVTYTLFRYTRGSAVMLDYPMRRISRNLFTAQSLLMVSDPAYQALSKLRLDLANNAASR